MATKQIAKKIKNIQCEDIENFEGSGIFFHIFFLRIMLPRNDKNIVGHSRYLFDITTSQDWLAAKSKFDLSAADRIIDLIWTPRKTEALRLMYAGASAVLITVPSTTRKNAVPIRFAKRLSEALKAGYITGNDYFSATHLRASKNIPRLERVFLPREYVAKNIAIFSEKIKDKNIIVVEDVLTTGGSAAKFIKALKDQDIRTDSVVALMGERRLKVDEKTKIRLNEALESLNISAVSESVLENMALTRTEAGGLIQTIKARRSESARKEIAGKLQRLFYGEAVTDLGRVAEAGRNQSDTRRNDNNGRVSAGVSSRSVLGSGGRVGIKEIMERFGEAKESGQIKDIKGYERAIIRSKAGSAEKNKALREIYAYKKALGIGRER